MRAEGEMRAVAEPYIRGKAISHLNMSDRLASAFDFFDLSRCKAKESKFFSGRLKCGQSSSLHEVGSIALDAGGGF